MADTNDKAYEIMAAIKEAMDWKNHMLNKTSEKLNEVDAVLFAPDAKDKLTYNDWQYMYAQYNKLSEQERKYVESSYALETAYNICLEILGEQE